MKLDLTQRKVLLIYGTIILVGFSYTAVIMITGHAIPCLFRELTGLLCPGCGSTRMVLAAMQGNFQEAFAYNPVAFVAFGCWFIISVLVFIGKPESIRTSKVLLGILYVTTVAYCVQCVVRNVI